MKRLFIALLSLMVFTCLFFINVAVADDLIYGCKHKQNGKLRIVQNRGECTKSEILISWNEQGPQGEQGIQGIQGIQGEQGIQGPPGGSPPIAFINGTVDFDGSQATYSTLRFGAYRPERSSGGGFGGAIFEDVMLIMPSDNKLFPELMSNAAAKRVLAEVKIYLGASTMDFVILYNVLVSQIETVHSGQNMPSTQFAISLNYEEIDFFWGNSSFSWIIDPPDGGGCLQSDTNFIDDTEYTGGGPFHGYIPISLFSFGIQSPRRARAQFDAFKVIMDLNDAAPCFLNNEAKGMIIPKVNIEKWAGTSERLNIELENVLTVGFQLFPSTNGIPAIELEFNYEKATITHYQYDSGGNPMATTTVELDVENP